MKRLYILGMVVPAFALAVAVAQPAVAQDKAKDTKAMKAEKTENKAEKGKPVTKVLHEDDKVRVTETTTKPGDTGASITRGLRVVRYLQGGTQLRTYADGKTEKVERKTGEVFVAGPDKQAYSVKNVGKTTMVTYTVNIKGAK
jgi:hypothetical protein